MKIKTSELEGAALDWAVASIEKLPNDVLVVVNGKPVVHRKYWGEITELRCEFSTNWAQGGPIIEREGIDLYCNVPSSIAIKNEGWEPSWRARYSRCGYGTEMMHGPTPLIAAMRCYVASKLGDEVEVPDELC